MFRDGTTIVVGAGASKEVNIPCGSELQTLIAGNLNFQRSPEGRIVNGNEEVLNALRLVAEQGFSNYGGERFDFDELVNSAIAISRAMPISPSIDNYIHAHRTNRHTEVTAKIAIVKVILDAERTSSLKKRYEAPPKYVDVSRIRTAWFNRFMSLLGEDCQLEEVGDRLSKIAFIVFNYDRCIEHYFFNALQIFYRIDEKRAADLLTRLRIYHPYGSIGPLPYENGNSVEFGQLADHRSMVKAAQRIKTFTEGADPTLSKIVGMRKSIAESSTVLFIGFAFHPLNLKLLEHREQASQLLHRRMCLATAYAMSESDCQTVRDDLQQLLRTSPGSLEVCRTLTCAGLLDEYRRLLASR